MTAPFLDNEGRRLLGFTLDDAPIVEPSPGMSSIIYAAAGGGKTTCVSSTTIQSLLASTALSLVINDVKQGEIAHQIAEMCARYGRKFGVIDPFHVMGADYPFRIELNAFGSAVDLGEDETDDFPFAVEKIAYALVEEPSDDKKHAFFRDGERSFIEYGTKALNFHSPRLCTPGGLYAFLSNPRTLSSSIEIDCNDRDSPVHELALRLSDLKSYSPEHYAQHLSGALTALKVFSFGKLRDDGMRADITHRALVSDGWIVCLVNPIRYADRLGPYFAQHLLSFMGAQLSGAGRAVYVLDEFCNAPLRELVERITVFRAFDASALYITQSRQDVVRKYGEKETAVLEDNCAIKQWLKFSNFEDAERVSKAMGETLHVARTLGTGSERLDLNDSMAVGREPLMSPHELMAMPAENQVLHVAGVGFLYCKKVRQNQIAPTCFKLAPNPLEGGRLEPDPKVVLPTPDGSEQ
jgi:type IV secretion system protein VirD4